MLSETEQVRQAFAGRYHVERELGAGGMATVYLARDLRHDRAVALKLLRLEVAYALGADRFAREIAIAGRLTHPNIVAMFDSGTVVVGAAELPYYVMPYIAGESLRDRLTRERQLPMDEVLRVAHDVAEALDFAHSEGVVHRDVKPENVLLLRDHALLADFGIARAASYAAGGNERLTSTGIAIGTPAYMSPEQAAGDSVDARTDTYALAAITYEMLSGQPPYTGATPQAILARQVSGAVLPLHTVRPGAVTETMDAVIRRALSPAAADRYDHALDFVKALQQSNAVSSASGHAPARRRRSVMTLAGLAAALLMGAFVLQLLRPGPPGDARLGLGVMPFRAFAGADEFTETFPDLLATFLDGTPGVRVADPWALWRPLRDGGSTRARTPDPDEAARLARGAGVTRFVLGGLVRSGDRLDVTLRIYDTNRDGPITTFVVRGSVDSSAVLAQRTAVEVLQRVLERSETDGPPQVPASDELLTQSPDALKAYLAAREAMRRGMPDSANAAITRAIGHDSAFALALLEAVSIRSWLQSTRGEAFAGLRELMQRALADQNRLTEREALRLRAMLASIETDGVRAATALRQLLERDSTDLMATNLLSYVQVVYGWQFGATLEDMIRIADRALAIDSTDVPALYHRAQLALASYDRDDVQRQLVRLKALDAGAPLTRASILGIEALLADDRGFAASLDTLAVLPQVEFVGVFRALRSYRPDRAVALTRRATRLAAPGPGQTLAANALAGLMGAAGDFRVVDSLWTAGTFAGAGSPPFALAQKLVHAALAGIEDSALTARALDLLERFAPIDSASHYFDKRPIWSLSFTLGSWHAQRGDTARARRWLETVAALPGGGNPRTWREAITADIAGRLAHRRGAADSAYVLAQRAFDLWTVHTENASDAAVEPTIRYRLATQLLNRGMRDSAVRLLQSFGPPVSWMGSYVPLSEITLGSLAESRGDPARAARYYDRALQLLELGGPAVAALRTQAQQGLRRTARQPPWRYGTD